MSTPPFDPDDPRMTAYALGEAGPSDQQAVEKILSESTEARAEVEQTRALGLALKTAYAREHALYLASRPEAAMLPNVVEFRADRQRGWPRAAVTGLKAAAVLTLAASLVYLTLRRPQHPESYTVASVPPVASVGLPAPAPVPVAPPSKDEAFADRDAVAPANAMQAPDFDRAPAATPADSQLAQTTTNSVDAPVTNVEQQTEVAVARSRQARSSGAPLPPAAAPGTAAGGAATVLPSAASMTAASMTAAVSGFDKFSVTDQRIARSMVRIRTASGAFFGGVLVSSDGLILPAASLTALAEQQPCKVLLADTRELPAVVQPSKPGASPVWLRIDAKGLPAVALASNVPTDDVPLTVAFVSRRTGAPAFSHVRATKGLSQDREVQAPLEKASQSDGEAAFAFNAAGELLVMELSAPELKSVRRAKAADERASATRLLVRPFTESERASLKQASESKGKE